MDSHVITEYGKQNFFAKETKPYIDEEYKGYIVEAEQLNGRLAMIAFFGIVLFEMKIGHGLLLW